MRVLGPLPKRLEWLMFYEREVEGVTFVDWVDALVAGGPPGDVHGTHCTPG